MARVFGVGLSRTGTFSLHVALQILGYRSVHFPKTVHDLDNHDAAVDTSVILGMDLLEACYPDSKFILTVRDPMKWAKSVVKHWGDSSFETDTFEGRVRAALYGDLKFTEDNIPELSKVFRRHIHRVLDKFANHPDKLLLMDITAGANWDVLCPFLGLPIPKVPFPHVTCC